MNEPVMHRWLRVVADAADRYPSARKLWVPLAESLADSLMAVMFERATKLAQMRERLSEIADTVAGEERDERRMHS